MQGYWQEGLCLSMFLITFKNLTSLIDTSVTVISCRDYYLDTIKSTAWSPGWPYSIRVLCFVSRAVTAHSSTVSYKLKFRGTRLSNSHSMLQLTKYLGQGWELCLVADVVLRWLFDWHLHVVERLMLLD